MKKATTLIILMMWMVNTHFYAAPISVKKAQEIAESMSLFSPSTRQSNVTLQCIYTPGESTRSADVYAPYYVFGPQNNSGFVIISGDDELHSLVGYSVDNTFDIDKIPVQLQALLSDYAMYVAAIQSGEVAAPDLSKRSANGVVVAPMITTKWDQSKPYNDLCTPYYTGCVATAMAQIMNYHKWPAQANASLDNMPNDYRVPYEITIDWDNMLDEYNQKWNSSTQSYEPLYNAEQANAVANLMTVCGVAVRMGYGTKASSAFSFSVANALRKFLKYSPKIDIHERNNYLPDEWIVLLRSNLEQNMPFMYSGFGNGGGHAFVCDGIDAQDLLHINWGWSGYCDGYFDVCYMSPSGVGIGGGTGDFNKEQDIISGIRPLAADEIEMTEIPRTLYISEYSITSDLILSKNDVNNCFRIAMGRVSNYTDIFRTESFAFGIAVVDKDGNVKSLNSQSYSFKHASYRNLISYNLIVGVDFYDREKKAFFPNGDYEIIPVMCNFDGDQPTHISQFIKMRYNGSSSDIKATITDTEIILHQDNQFTPYDLLLKDIIIPSKLYANYDNEQIVIKVENKGTTNYEGNLEAYYIHESIDDSNIYVALSQPCSWGTGCAIYGNKEIDVYLTMPQLTSIGKYKIRVFYKTNAYDKEEISSESTYYITISEAPNSPMVKMESALNIYYSKEDRKNNYLNVSVKLKANKTYEGPIQLYALRDGAAENDEILLMECEEVITTTTKWISELYGYSLDYLNLPAGSYILYLKYLHEGEMIKITPDYYNTFTMTLSDIPADVPTINAPIVINDGMSILDGQFFTIKTTLLSTAGYKGLVSASIPYINSDGNWDSAGFLYSKELDLAPNVPQEIDYTGMIYNNTPAGDYKLEFYYKYGEYYYDIPLKEYGSTAGFSIVNMPFVLSAPIVINYGNDVKQGSSGKVHITLNSNINYPGGYFYIQENPQVVKGDKSNISTLPYKQDQIVELNYTCNANAPLGEHAINIIYEHPSTKVDTQLDLGEHANSAKFNVISSTGITDEEASSIYAYQSGDGFVIKGLLGCEEISIYDMSGKAVLQMTATSSEEFVSENMLGSKNCIVVIKDGNKQAVIKVSLK